MAPRPVSLVLWFLGPGWSAIESHHHYAAQLQRLQAENLRAQLDRQAHELARARSLAQFHGRHAPAAANVDPWPITDPIQATEAMASASAAPR